MCLGFCIRLLKWYRFGIKSSYKTWQVMSCHGSFSRVFPTLGKTKASYSNPFASVYLAHSISLRIPQQGPRKPRFEMLCFLLRTHTSETYTATSSLFGPLSTTPICGPHRPLSSSSTLSRSRPGVSSIHTLFSPSAPSCCMQEEQSFCCMQEEHKTLVSGAGFSRDCKD